ncbi:MAG: tetratricopeptide repeat protein [Woeseia sp.]|nr:tetratricopeptide repeat protein [Woeseia sp.]MBT8096573.1 tetratricopeptide repeat protein [Woeseia sp.]NNE60225.1 tetratricopeptide repeat protein [Woeseia sp.]NNL56069.1 tetratricopeptide repeat protein [Woeseia sp.]
MTLQWIIFGCMAVAGALCVCWPMYRQKKKLTPSVFLAAVAVVALSVAMYAQIGTPAAPPGVAAAPSVDEMVASLAARLEEDPNDVAGWKMLGRSYFQLQQYDKAVAAYEQALQREGGSDAQTSADLGEAMLLTRDEQMAMRASELFEAALVAAPQNPKALFYGGIAAIERGDRELAADRWEALLAQSPPPNVQAILRERISEWRGLPAVVPTNETAAGITLDVSVAASARNALGTGATVFVIARDPAQPSPPIAVTRRKLTELPATITLTDADAMIPGRTLGQFAALEVLVRASKTGEPLPQAGDWFGSAQIAMPQQGTVEIAIADVVE